MTSNPVLTIGPNNGIVVYSSIRSAARALSGTGIDRSRTAIGGRIASGGGFIGDVWVTDGTSFVRPTA